MRDSEASLASPRSAPSRPRWPLPANACDCHAHLFGPFDRFPVPAEPNSKSVLAPFDDYRRMLDAVGFTRAAVVQPSAYRQDCRALLSALRQDSKRLRGVAIKDRHVSDRELSDLHDAGVRGLRFNELVGRGSSIGIGEFEHLAPRLRELGWHAQIYAACEGIAAALPALLSHRIPVVIDHLARVGPSERTIDDPAFQAVLAALKDGGIWIKLTAYRNGRNPPCFDDVRVFHDAFVNANPDRLLWGSDWPFLSALDDPPDTGRLLDVLGDWVSDAAVRRKILVTNPETLYGFEAH
ncbi:MAG: amidohydrolase family protein [Hyphomicrobium sp.]